MTIPDDFPITTEVIDHGEVHGIPWVTARAPFYGAANGYIRVPDNHPWLHVEYMYDIENTVPWGEITYGKGNWLGFDSMHSGQYWPDDRYGPYPGDELMTDAKVIGWTKQLANEAHNTVDNGTYSI